MPTVGQPANQESSGKALATVTPGNWTLRDQQQDLASLNQDPAKANAPAAIYDLKALESSQKDAAIISESLNLAVGDIAELAGFEEGSPEKTDSTARAGRRKSGHFLQA